jgi:hypothetical protein
VEIIRAGLGERFKRAARACASPQNPTDPRPDCGKAIDCPSLSTARFFLKKGADVPDDRVALIRQIKEANDIVDVVGGYLALHPVGGTFKGLCPFHDDSRPSFDVDPRRQRYRCWSCGKYGDVRVCSGTRALYLPRGRQLLARRAASFCRRSASSEARDARFSLTSFAGRRSDTEVPPRNAPRGGGGLPRRTPSARRNRPPLRPGLRPPVGRLAGPESVRGRRAV